MIEALEEDLTNYLRRLDDTPEPVAHAFRVAYAKHGISSNDVRVIVGHGDKQSEIARLRGEVQELRVKLDRVQGARGLSWQEFVTACGDKIDTQKRGWRNTLASHLNCSIADFAVWEEMDRVPYTLLNQLTGMPDLRVDNPATRSANLTNTVAGLVAAMRSGRASDKQIGTLLTQLLVTANTQSLQAALDSIFAEPRVTPTKPPKDITGRIGPRAPSAGTFLIEEHCRELAARLLKDGTIPLEMAKKISKKGAIRNLIRDGWAFQANDTLVAYIRREEFPEEWKAADAVRRDYSGLQLAALEALDRYCQDHPEGCTLAEWHNLTSNSRNKEQRGGVNSMVSDFQRRRRGEGIVIWHGSYPKTRWSLRLDWRDG